MKKDFDTPSGGKTETIKKRLIYVYLPSETMVKKWKRLAEDEKVSISKFVFEHVENSLRQEDGEEDHVSRIDLIERNKILEEENMELRKRGRMLDTVVERLEGELREYRVKPFVDEDFVGVRKYQSEIIDLFKSRGTIRKDELLRLLEVNPKETVVVKGIGKQIAGLESYGLVKDKGAKWQWVK